MNNKCHISGRTILLSQPENDFMETMNLCDNGIVYCRLKNSIITLEMIRQMMLMLSSLTRKQLAPVIFDMRQVKKVTPDALSYLWNNDRNYEYAHAVFLVNRDYNSYGPFMIYSYHFYKPAANHELKFRIMMNIRDAIPRAERWLTRRADPVLVEKIKALTDSELKMLIGICYQRTGLEIAEISNIPYSTVSKKKGDFTRNRLGTSDLIKIIKHLSFVPDVEAKTTRYAAMYQRAINYPRTG